MGRFSGERSGRPSCPVSVAHRDGVWQARRQSPLSACRPAVVVASEASRVRVAAAGPPRRDVRERACAGMAIPPGRTRSLSRSCPLRLPSRAGSPPSDRLVRCSSARTAADMWGLSSGRALFPPTHHHHHQRFGPETCWPAAADQCANRRAQGVALLGPRQAPLWPNLYPAAGMTRIAGPAPQPRASRALAP